MESSPIEASDISEIVKLLVQGLGIILAVVAASTVCLIGGYFLSTLLLPHWPPDYHASIAICLLMVVGFGGVAFFAFRTSRG